MGASLMKAVIFAGPSLPPRLRPADPRLDWRPPARQGDVYRAALERPAIIGIIDGYFETVPSVWHKEILWAMAEGIHVYGAASTGALRAAELAPFGMKGVGKIFEAFRDGLLEDDDEVAILHGPAELGYPALSEAMVNIRATLEQAVSEGVIEAEPAVRLTEIAKALFYKERDYSAILQKAAERGLPEPLLEVLSGRLPYGRIDAKLADALAMLIAVGHHLAGGISAFQPRYSLSVTAAWRRASSGPDLPLPRSLNGANLGSKLSSVRRMSRESPRGVRAARLSRK